MGRPEVCTFPLANGLRVVLAPDHAFPLAAVSVHYDVGHRSGPAGFAHLFQDLMCQGSESVGALAHSFYVESSGGSFGSSTSMDYTNYFSVVPSAALERALFLEADRMRAPRLTEENVRCRIGEVKEQFRQNVLDRPYGGFPWLFLSSLAHPTLEDLLEATLDDCAAFFDQYYAPGNAVLTVAGDFTIDQVRELVENHFGDVPARETPKREVDLNPEEIRGERYDPHAPLPALAVGYQLPDLTDDRYLANVLLASVLSDGENARLKRMMREDSTIVAANAVCGLSGPFCGRQPDMLTISFTHLFTPDRPRMLSLIDEGLDLWSRSPLTDEEFRSTVGRWLADHHGHYDLLVNRACALGTFELLHGDARHFDQLPSRIERVTAADVVAAADALRHANRAVLTLRASGDKP